MLDSYVYLIAIAGLIAAMVPVIVIGRRRWKEQVEEVFGGRQELSDRDFYERYFEAKGVPFYIVKKIREILEEVFDADLSRLAAEDDFSKNLGYFWEFDSAADLEIILLIEEEFGIEISDEEAPNLFRTVEGIVDFVWRKVKEKDESGN